MKGKSLLIKVLLPTILLMTVLALFAVVRTQFIINEVIDTYGASVVADDRSDFYNILSVSVSEQDALNNMQMFLGSRGFIYRVSRGGEVLAYNFPFPSHSKKPNGLLRAKLHDVLLYGYTAESEKFNFSVAAIRELPQIASLKRELNATISVFLLSILLMILAVLLIMKKNLFNPIKRIMSSLARGESPKPAAVAELDELVHVVNSALSSTAAKKLHVDALHRIAVSLNKNVSLDEIMDTIVEESVSLIDAEYAAVALYDEDGNFAKLDSYGVDEAVLTQMLGRTSPEGKGILKLMQRSLTPVHINTIAEHPAFSGEFPEGHPVLKNFLGYPIFSKEGMPLGALYFANKRNGGFTAEDETILAGIASDAAVAIQRIQGKAKLEQFKRIIESSFDAIVFTDKEGTISYVNPAFERMAGYPASEVLGKNPRILKSDLHDQNFYKNLWETICEGRPWKGEFLNKKKNGEIYCASAVVFPLISDAGEITHFISIQRDITEEKKLYEQLLRSQKMEAIGTLAGGIAHDFNNLLTAILGYSEILLTMTTDKDSMHKPAHIIYSAAEKGAELAKKILTITRKEKMEAKACNINEIINDSMDILRSSIPKDIEVVVNLTKDIQTIMADASHIHQIIMNLAVNARDAMPHGGMLVIETSLVGKEHGAANGITGEGDGFVRLSVSDTGMGIDAEIQRKVFEPFFTTKEVGKGTGLGLYIVQSIVDNHGGYLNLYSEPGKGTRFNIYFPIAKTESPEASNEHEEDLRGSGKILVIDDESAIRELSRDMLQPLGYTVLTAEGGAEGIALFRQLRDEISLVILDMIMPKMNGSETFQTLKTISPEVKVLLCSGYSHDGFAGIDILMKDGARGFIQKPYTIHTLAKSVKKAITS